MRTGVLCMAMSFAALAGGNAFGAVTRIKGTEPTLWERISVVYGRVIAADHPRRGQLSLNIDVLATLTGTWDPAGAPRMQSCVVFGAETAIRESPPPGTHVLVVVARQPDRSYLIPSAHVSFMPSDSAIQRVEGFDDPRVRQVIARLRELRAGSSAKESPPSRELPERESAPH